MNRQDWDVLAALRETPYTTQRALAEQCGYSLGSVNRSLQELTSAGYLDENRALTEKAKAVFADRKPKNAVILAAGFGMRMVPINMESPKALVEVKGQRLIDRLIGQLQEAGITDITVVVGFMKEKFEYLIDTYGVKLTVNPDYAGKNNLHSLLRAKKKLDNTYIVPCDIWCKENPFRAQELYSWYMVTDSTDPDSTVRVNRKLELTPAGENTPGNQMIGISYLLRDRSQQLTQALSKLASTPEGDEAFWEDALFAKGAPTVESRMVSRQDVVEINTYEQLRELDSGSSQLHTDAITTIAKAMNVEETEITDITVLKKGMTNRSFLFNCKGKKYIMRIPGEGTDQLINRREETQVYRQLDGKGICDDIVYINPDNGYKITAYLEGARVCDPDDVEDLKRCMEKLRAFHQQGLQVEHTFDIFRQIDFYESLWNGATSVYDDYEKTKQQVFSLLPYIEKHKKPYVLTHIDAVPDNFLFVGDEIRLIDWEYAGLQDPHVDIAMFCIYSLYEREQVERLIDLYFPEGCKKEDRIKIYCYIAACGLLWSNWCEYKRQLGVEFGEYSLRQYRFAKDYYRIAIREMEDTCA